MNLGGLRILAARVVGSLTRRRRDARLSDEIRTHLDLLADEHMRRGMPTDQARAAARRAFGGVDQITEAYRDQRGLPLADGLLQDLRYAGRTLRRSPGFTFVAAVSLAIGIGFNAASFAFVDALLFAPLLPVERSDRLVDVYTSGVDGGPYRTSSYPDYLDFRARADVFIDILAYSPSIAAVKSGDLSRMAIGEVVTGNYFQLLGVGAAVGRTLLPEDDRPGAPRAVMISHRVWQRDFGASSSAVGQSLRIHGQPYVIVGVSPERFAGMTPILPPEVWTPMAWVEEIDDMGISEGVPSPGRTRLERRGYRWLFLKGRLKDGQTAALAGANLQAVMQQLASQYPAVNGGRRVSAVSTNDVRIHPLADRVIVPASAGLTVLVGLVLLVVCANVTSMLLARASGRQKEIGIRLAMGASRGRLVRQLLTESVVLSALGAMAGVALLWALMRAVGTITPPAPLSKVDLRLGTRVLWFSAGLSIVAGLIAGVAPALRATRSDLVAELNSGGSRIQFVGRRWSLRDGLVIFQIAVALVLVVTAALLARSMMAAQNIDVGFRTEGLVAVSPAVNLIGYDESQATQFFERALERVRAIPGVEAAALARRLPLDITNFAQDLILPQDRPAADDKGVPTETTFVSPDYFATLGVRLLEGRNFTSADTPASPRVAIINETMARRYWPSESAVGKRFHVRTRDGAAVDVVGVSADHKVRTVGENATPYIHYALSQRPSAGNLLFARTHSDPDALGATIRRELLEIEPNLVVLGQRTMREQVATALLPARLAALGVSVVGAVAMALAAVGLYGVIAYSVGQRTREIGIRVALGARPRTVVGLVMRQGLTLSAIGASIGAVLASGAALAVSRALYGVGAADRVAWGGAMAVLLGVSLLAHVVPARRAARVDPMVALRCE